MAADPAPGDRNSRRSSRSALQTIRDATLAAWAVLKLARELLDS